MHTIDNTEESPVSESHSLTSWENEPTVTDLKQDYTDAKAAHDVHVSNVRTWLDNLNVTGSAKRKKETNRSSVTPKLIRKQAEWRYSSLSEPFLSTEDLFDTAPVTFEDKKGAYQAGLVLNYQFNHKIKKVAFIDEYVRTDVDEGSVVIKVGWEFEEKEVEVEVSETQQIPITDPMKAQQMIDQGLPPYEEIEIGSNIETQTKTIKNHPTAEIVNYNNIVIDPTCLGDIDKAGFAILSVETCMSDLEKSSHDYKNLDKIVLSEVSVLATPDHDTPDETTFKFKDEPRKKFVIYEYWGFWDIHNTGIVEPIVATYAGETMIRMEENPFPDKKLPFIIVQYLPVRKSIYGQPDGELLIDNQEIIGAVTRGMIDILARSANGQMGIRKDALDVTNKRKFDRGEDYEFNGGVSARDAFYTHTFATIPESARYLLEQQNADAESLTGVKAFHSGITGSALGDSVGGIKSALDATSKRELGILRRLAEGIKEIGRKFMSMNSEFLGEEEVVRVTNEVFEPIHKDDLAGKYDITLTISTAETDNDKAENLGFMMQTMGNSMDAGLSQMILADIARLRKLPALAKKIEEYQPQPDPLDQERKQLEVDLLKAQIANEYAKAKENEVDVGYKMARTETEKAKGRNVHSKTDIQDLDFLERDQGIPHQRELEKKDLDRKSALDLKGADHMLNADKMATTLQSNTTQAEV